MSARGDAGESAGRGDVARQPDDDGPATPLRDVLLIVAGTLYLVLHAGLVWFLEHGA